MSDENSPSATYQRAAIQKSTWYRMWVFVSFIAFSGAPQAEEAYDLHSVPKVRVEGEERFELPKPGRVPRPAARARAPMPGPTQRSSATVSWAGQATYQVRSDLADQIKPRVYTHTVGLSYGFQHKPSGISLAGILAATYESTGDRRSEILVDENRTELFVNDFTLAGQKDWDLPWRSSVSATLANEFPTSPEAQREQYASVTSVEVAWRLPLYRERLAFALRGELYHIWNTYEYSPATDELNKQGGSRGEASLRWSVLHGFYFGASAGAQLSRYLDGTSDLTYRNSASMGYVWPRISLSLSASNGTYLDRDDASLWFVDEYHRMLALNSQLSF